MSSKRAISFKLTKTNKGLQLHRSEGFHLTYINMLYLLWKAIKNNECYIVPKLVELTNVDELHREVTKCLENKKRKMIEMTVDEAVYLYLMFQLFHIIYKSDLAFHFMYNKESSPESKLEEHRVVLVESMEWFLNHIIPQLDNYPEYHYKKNHIEKVFPDTLL
jgi:hypothetical protein